jgi:hypothetical protein
MIDIDGAEGFSPFLVWARGGQAPLRAQATSLPDACPSRRTTSGYDKSAAISYYAIDHDLTLKRAALANGVSEELFDKALIASVGASGATPTGPTPITGCAGCCRSSSAWPG